VHCKDFRTSTGEDVHEARFSSQNILHVKLRSENLEFDKFMSGENAGERAALDATTFLTL